MTDNRLTDREIRLRLRWLLTLPPLDPILIAPRTEIRTLRELKAMRERRCANCEHYAYYDGPLCGLREEETWLFGIHKAPDDWSCADWQPRRD